jgi:ABC-2 type transport system ATP-binding protein
MIKIKELSKKFNGKYAVDDLSFDIAEGKVSGLLGPNGAGKTTTMRLMTGFLAPDSGDVFIDDVSVAESPKDVQKKIGYMPEANPLYEDMLVSEAFEFFANLKDIPKNSRRDAYDFVVDAVDLGDVFYRPIKELSKGYKQRTGLAIAILNRPDVLILDEPTEGLDPNQRTDIRKLIKDLSKDRTILISTHVMQEAQAVCDDLFIISDGKLVADGSTEELTKSLQNKKVFEVEIEGKNIEKEIKEIKGLDDIKVISSSGNKLSASVIVGDDVKFQPLLSELVTKHSWIIWKLSEKKERLEDVFYKLTNAE